LDLREFRRLKLNELEIWFDYCSNVFKNMPREYFANHWYNDPWRDINSIFVVVENDQILSSLRIFHRELYFHGKKIKMGGIGEVTTIPEARKMGLSTELFKKAIEYMKQKDINISLLFGSHLNYSRLGWKALNYYWKISDIVPCERIYTIRKVDFDKDYKALKNIYNKYATKFNGTVVRDDDFYWTNWIQTEDQNCFVAEDHFGNVIGYMGVDMEENTAVVKDFGVQSEQKNIFEQLAFEVCDRLGMSEIKYPAAINHTLNTKSDDKTNNTMFRLISPFEINHQKIMSTDELIKMLNSKFLFWNVDGF
jgi:predicted N-acetyltransferase YhbS